MEKYETIPKITHLQFYILTYLLGKEQSGSFIREMLKQIKEYKSHPAFYQLMGRMEKSKLVVGKYNKEVYHNQMLRTKNYKITEKGKKIWFHCKMFYQDINTL